MLKLINKKYYLYFITLLLFVGCSRLSENLVKEKTFYIKGGKHSINEWDNELAFKQVSWFKGLSLLYESYMAEMNVDSPFMIWFSAIEKEKVRNCNSFFVAMSYSLDSKRIPHSLFRAELERNSYYEVSIPHFSANLRLHPDYHHGPLVRHKVWGFCRTTNNKRDVAIAFPGYGQVTINQK